MPQVLPGVGNPETTTAEQDALASRTPVSHGLADAVIVNGGTIGTLTGLVTREAGRLATEEGEGLGFVERSPLLSAEDATARFGIDGKLTFDRPMTEREAAWRQAAKRDELFRQDILQRNDSIGPIRALGLSMFGGLIDPVALPFTVALDLPDPAAFFAYVRGKLWPRLSQSQVEGCERIIGMCGRARLPLSHAAYVLATVYHETGYAMQPVREKGGAAYLSKYDTGKLAAALGNTPEADGDGVLYAGRGDVQLTGARNYGYATVRLRAIGILSEAEDLGATPDLALRPDVSAAVCVYGMAEGWFTGRKLATLNSPARKGEFENARRIVNGVDRAADIAGYALHFQTALKAGGWA